MYNAREGFGRSDDSFPLRFTKEPKPSGPSSGQVFEEDEMLNDYYHQRGWDIETGNPTRVKLEALALAGYPTVDGYLHT
jgi:aldehyde:ferredoxin oxidoreductase